MFFLNNYSIIQFKLTQFYIKILLHILLLKKFKKQR